MFQLPWRHQRESGGKILSGRLVRVRAGRQRRPARAVRVPAAVPGLRDPGGRRCRPRSSASARPDRRRSGVVGGALALGTFLATAIGTRLRIRRPVRLQAIGLGRRSRWPALWAAVRFTLTSVALFCLVAAVASGLAKLAVDASIQERIPDTVRASAFAHAETLLMLAWVAGGAIGLIPFLAGRLGLAVAALGDRRGRGPGRPASARRLRGEVLRGRRAAGPRPAARPRPARADRPGPSRPDRRAPDSAAPTAGPPRWTPTTGAARATTCSDRPHRTVASPTPGPAMRCANGSGGRRTGRPCCVVTAVDAERDAVRRGPADGRPRPATGSTVDGGRGRAGRGGGRAPHGLLVAGRAAGDPFDVVVCAGIAGGFAGRAGVGADRAGHPQRRRRPGRRLAGRLPAARRARLRTVHSGRRCRPAGRSAAAAARRRRRRGAHRQHRHRHGRPRPTSWPARHPDAVAEAMEGFGVACAAAAGRVPRSPSCARSPTRSARATGPPGGSTTRLAALAAARWPWPAVASLDRRVGSAAGAGPAPRLLALPQRHVRLPRAGARPGAGRAAGRGHLRRRRRDQHRGRCGGEFDLVKVSYAALPWLLDQYELLPCGGALGRGCGPLVLAARRRRRLAGRAAAWRCPATGPPRTCCMRLWSAAAPPAAVDRGAVRRDHAGGGGRALRRRAGHPRGPLHLPPVRPARPGRPRRVVGERHRPADPARRDPGPPRRGRPGRGGRVGPGLGAARPGPTRPPAATTCWPTRRRWSPTWSTSTSALYVNAFTEDLGAEGYAAVDALLGRAAAEGLVPPVPTLAR